MPTWEQEEQEEQKEQQEEDEDDGAPLDIWQRGPN